MLATHEDSQDQAGRAGQPPLCVDLDGTLVRGDLLYEAAVALLRQSPGRALLLPLWLLRGKAYLKEQLAARVTLDPATLPYNAEVVTYLREEAANGRRLVLVTAGHQRFAGAVANHLGLFDEVLATDGRRNLKGAVKAEALRQRFGAEGFDYIGDSPADLPVWEDARKALLVHPSRKLLEQAGQRRAPDRVFPGCPGAVRAALRLARPHQWSKNLLLLLPLLLAHRFSDLPRLFAVLLALVSFCCCASAVYVLNDLLDLEADRRHPTKRHRPLAAGALPIPTAAGMMGLLLAGGLGIPLLLSPAFLGMAAGYLVLATAYSLRLKREPILDVFVLAGLYTHRILAGGVAAGVPVSGWMLAFSVFFFLSLALAKRYAELARASAEERHALDRRGYVVDDLGLIQVLGPASGYMAVLTFCLYINAQDVLCLYRAPGLLWGICLVLLYWVTRLWFLARRRLLHEDPIVFATHDRVGYVCGAVVLVVLALAA